MLSQYFLIKSGEIIIRNLLLCAVVLLLFAGIRRFFNIDFNLVYVLLGAICYRIVVEIINYRKFIYCSDKSI
ncbi:hypothetical protein DealDRAFT_0370 [Dethiobacter alkaliphilus AHT 1]|uniref:Uncharacterized protein n=1 Tax=Dethiobacter alkaliphilus AHT 1 TaxID=555088 RepID=C0GD11_DETAL|nr:hypothetical protein DealDRAFT_0370 [Dethiobacter alkaliphilus AHT 1]